jgi:hypothetical protein
VAIESCNGAANLTEELIPRAGWSVSLAHPGYVKRRKQNPDKTDDSDARMLGAAASSLDATRRGGVAAPR